MLCMLHEALPWPNHLLGRSNERLEARCLPPKDVNQHGLGTNRPEEDDSICGVLCKPNDASTTI